MAPFFRRPRMFLCPPPLLDLTRRGRGLEERSGDAQNKAYLRRLSGILFSAWCSNASEAGLRLVPEWNEFARSCRAVSERGDAGNSSPERLAVSGGGAGSRGLEGRPTVRAAGGPPGGLAGGPRADRPLGRETNYPVARSGERGVKARRGRAPTPSSRSACAPGGAGLPGPSGGNGMPLTAGSPLRRGSLSIRPGDAPECA
ncbi:hypothetical protein AAFF_G00073750 [Aldrovandia affinis]|uniref:Uncharacterized protein n=1 Tax=Aldrovandia affinis TaxID=143900 RepID=A0AAD7RYE4_9TELE|nr:hypothetical protein AAFF_G00073750 [Aldrovandia affinis]